jgi:PBP1b-binding outer membrane lipoprotein LpoB
MLRGGAAILCAAFLVSCGYHVGGKADLVPQSIQTIAVPPFRTVTTKYRMVDILPEQISQEFRSRTRFKIEKDQSVADAILVGTINNVILYPVVSDPTTGKATSIRIVVFLTVKLTDRKTGKVLYTKVNWGVREDYSEAIDPHQFFDESGAAYDRLCKDVARDLVSSIIENF